MSYHRHPHRYHAANTVPYRNLSFESITPANVANDAYYNAQKNTGSDSGKGFWDVANSVLTSIFEKPDVNVQQAPAAKFDYTPLYVAMGFAALILIVHIIKR